MAALSPSSFSINNKLHFSKLKSINRTAGPAHTYSCEKPSRGIKGTIHLPYILNELNIGSWFWKRHWSPQSHPISSDPALVDLQTHHLLQTALKIFPVRMLIWSNPWYILFTKNSLRERKFILSPACIKGVRKPSLVLPGWSWAHQQIHYLERAEALQKSPCTTRG